MGESTKNIRIFVIIVLSLFMLAMIYFTASVVKGFKNGAARAEQDFTQITQAASAAVFFDTNSPALNELRNLLTSNQYAAAVLVAAEKNVLFAYPAASPLIGMNAEGKPVVRSSSPMLRIFSTRLSTAPDDNTMLTVALYAVRSADIYNPARISFLVILIGLAAVIAVLIYTSKSEAEKESLSHVSEPIADEPEEQQSTSHAFFEAAPDESTQIHDSIPDEQAADTDTACISTSKSLSSHAGDLSSDDISSSDTEPEQLFPHKNSRNVGIAEETVDPSGLFSPATGVGWEQYLETRLDSELRRSASSEQDLALVLLRIPGIENNRLMMKKIAAVLLDFFKFKDFVFEYKNDGFAGILLNINLDQTMVLAETVYTQFKELLESENIPAKLALGISMRSLRLLPGSSLIDEADKALQKAFSETGMPIVAFRVNPDKYRQFMADSARKS